MAKEKSNGTRDNYTKKRVQEILEKINPAYVREQVANIKTEDVKRVIYQAESIINKVRKFGPLERYVDDVQTMIAMTTDYWKGRYREVPFFTISAVAFSLLYVLTPIDLIPDFIPVLGLLDDLAVLGIAIHMIEKDLQAYKEWLVEQQ